MHLCGSKSATCRELGTHLTPCAFPVERSWPAPARAASHSLTFIAVCQLVATPQGLQRSSCTMPGCAIAPPYRVWCHQRIRCTPLGVSRHGEGLRHLANGRGTCTHQRQDNHYVSMLFWCGRHDGVRYAHIVLRATSRSACAVRLFDDMRVDDSWRTLVPGSVLHSTRLLAKPCR